MMSRRHGPAVPVGLSLLACVILLVGGPWVVAQVNPQTAAQPPSPTVAKPQPPLTPGAPAAKTASAPEFVGPPAPGAPVQMPQAGQPAKAGADSPTPTVVLKPGEVPAIKFDQADWDFGRIQAGPEISHDFWFTNTGTGPLEILKVKPG